MSYPERSVESVFLLDRDAIPLLDSILHTGDASRERSWTKSPTFEHVTLSLQSLYVQQRCKNGDENRRQDRDQCQSATRILMHKDLRQHQGDDAAD